MDNEKNSFENVLNRLVKLEMFKSFSAENERDRNILKALYESCTVKRFKKGDLIIREGDFGDELYILTSGSVFIHRKTPHGDDIAIVTLNDSMNVFFGEAALIGKDSRSASITATTDCTTLVIKGKDFEALSEKEPLLGCRVFKCIASRMQKSIARANSDIATLYEALFLEIEGDQ